MAAPATEEERQERRSKVAVMLLGHSSVLGMATALGVNRNTITADIKAIREEWKHDRSGAYERYAAEEVPKLDMLEHALWTKAMAGSGEAVERILMIMERRARLLGLDEPAKLRINVVTEDELDAEIRRLSERHQREHPAPVGDCSVCELLERQELKPI